MKKKDVISLLIPDGENLLAIPVINCLSTSKQYKIYLISSLEYTPMRFSRYVDHFSYVPKPKNDDAWVTIIDKAVEAHDIDFIMPVSEGGIRKFIAHKHQLKASEKLMLVTDLATFDTANNKALLSHHLNTHKIPHPKSCLVSHMSELDTVKALHFPIISKPTVGYGGGNHIHVFQDMAAFKNHFKTNTFLGTHIIQEYIVGYDIDCSVLCKHGEILAYTIQKGVVNGTSDFAPAYAHVFLQKPKLFAVVQKLMKTLNWSGIAHVDLRFDVNTQDFKVIEINPRYWLSLEASLHAGINFPDLHYKLSIGQAFTAPECNASTYYSLTGIKLKVKQEKGVLFKWTFLKTDTALKFFIKDPIPVIYKFFALRLGNSNSVHNFED
ncbi:ATP-grasp domain-containing protein [uncultured Formosa sp.]|uniref:ATP-grasp domain-containing protein n=1 Tax=uncultured Formosa sp. TaxID=255435 RepID=UPI0026183AC9|nr:ATP-grasp domain-containing protein [uncultured Formosa sp.]